MITTVFHRLDVSDMQWQVSHLFEHLVIRGFYELVEHKGGAPELLGWINGETFEEALYIDAGFYDAQMAEDFEQYLQSPHEFTGAQVDDALQSIATEEKSILNVLSHARIIELLATLSRRKWDEKESRETYAGEIVIAQTNAVEQFHDLSVIVRANNLTVEEQKVFLRLRVILIDIILWSLATTPALYPQGNSDLALRDDSMAYMSIFTAPLGIDAPKVKNCIQDYLHSYEISNVMPQIIEHFDAFAREPLWQAMPIEFLRDTGLVVTNQEISELATPEVISAIFTKLSVVVRTSQPDDFAHIK